MEDSTVSQHATHGLSVSNPFVSQSLREALGRLSFTQSQLHIKNKSNQKRYFYFTLQIYWSQLICESYSFLLYFEIYFIQFFVVNITIPEGNLTPHYKEMLNFYKELKNIKQWEILYKISSQKKINQHFIFSKFVLENVPINTG